MSLTVSVWIIIGFLTLITILLGLIFRAVVILLQDIRTKTEENVFWLREIAGNSLDNEQENI